MRPIILHTSLLAVSILYGLQGALCRSLDWHSLDASLLSDAHFDIFRRADGDDIPLRTGKCTEPVHPLRSGRRDLMLMDILNSTDAEHGLERRAMTLPPSNSYEDMTDFMLAETGDDSRPSVWWADDQGQDQNTANHELFGINAMSLSGSLSGCTILLIVSRTGWYMAHYWESISFDTNFGDWPQFQNQQDALQRSVLDALTVGVYTGQKPAHISLTRVAGTFADDSVRAFIIGPSRTAQQVRGGYKDAWNQIRTTVGNIVPGLNPNTHADRWRDIRYLALDQRSDEVFESTATGRVLIKYDPDHPADSGRRKLTLWVERTQEFNDEW